jgi:hypothetical protein
VTGVDGDGVNDDQEGNLAAVSSNSGSSTFDMRDVDNCTFAGNWIGVKPDGVTLVNYLPGGNSGHTYYPIYLGNCVGTIIGTNGDGISDALERNVIADGAVAIWVTYNFATGTNPSFSGQPLREPGNNMVTGNYVGTDATGNTGTNRVGTGIALSSIGNYVGCNTSEVTNSTYRNIVSTMAGNGAIFELPKNSTNWDSVTNVIKGNWIGIGVNGTSAINGGYGIVDEHAVN